MIALMLRRATQFAAGIWLIPLEDLKLLIEPIDGGLESCVVRATCRSVVANEPRPSSQELRGLQGPGNEFTVNCGPLDLPPTVRLLGVEATQDVDYLYLEEATQHVVLSAFTPISNGDKIGERIPREIIK